MYRLVRHTVFPLGVFFGVCAIFLLFCTQISSAQILSTATLSSNPTTPEPHSKALVSLDTYALDTLGATILWYVDGKEIVDSRNARSINVMTGDLGEKTEIQAVLSRNGSSFEAKLTLVPTVIDLILEGNTYVPYFYHGRALLGRGANLRAVAIVHDNSSVSDTLYTYKWSLDQIVLLGGSVKGKNVIEIEMPPFDNKKLTVEVFNSAGVLVGKKSLSLVAQKPELHFYEESPLRGLGEQEIGQDFYLWGDEVTVFAEPYYIDARSGLDSVDFKWKIDGERVSVTPQDPNAIPLRRVGDSGSSRIEVEVVTKEGIPQFINGLFRVLFE